MTTAVALSPILNGQRFFLASGLPNAGGFIYTYAAGSTTPQVTYTENMGATPNANPVTLDAGGMPPNEIWLLLGVGYAFAITDAVGNPVASYDQIVGYVPTATPIPSGTQMAFYQAAPPAGWTPVSVTNDSMMRVVTSSTSGGTGGGTMSPVLMNVVPGHTHAVTTNVTDPGHSHIYSQFNENPGIGMPGGGYGSYSTLATGTATTGITVSATTDSGSSNTNWTPKYCDFCIGIKS